MKPLIITTPIYYVNDVPHIGHAYTTIAADVYARHHRMFGRRVFFLTGTDEHGIKVQKAAASRGLEPKSHCDETFESFYGLWPRLDISNDAFIRTTDAEHMQFVQNALRNLMDKKEIYESIYSGWYCIPCERYCTDKDINEGKCPECSRPVERLEEKNYFFKMGAFQKSLIDRINSGVIDILPVSRRNEVLGFLKDPLNDLCISRPRKRLSWGIPLPFDNDFVTYVWFDALMNYASATTYSPRLKGASPPSWDEAEVVHFIGKDILKPAHAVYWPCMLMANGMPTPTRIVAHGWWLVEGQKMSKTLGNVIDPNEIVSTYGSDAFRYFLLRDVPFGQDGDFSRESLIRRINHDLADEFGNLVGRVTALSHQKEKNILDLSAYHPDEPGGPRAQALLNCRQATEAFQFSVALTSLSELFSTLNKKINDERPWEASESKRRETLATAAVDLARGIFLLSPYTPKLAVEAAGRLGCLSLFKEPRRLFSDVDIKNSGPWQVVTGSPLVEKLEICNISPKQSSEHPRPISTTQLPVSKPGTIDISDFQKIDLRTARVLSAERVPGSDKLLKLTVATGPGPDETRQIVAGIARQYTPEKMTGKNIVIVSNLKPRKVFGVPSEGMILAAGDENTISILSIDGDPSPGMRVK